MKICGKDEGWFAFEKVSGGWKIRKTAKPGMIGVMQNPYLAVEDGKLIYTDRDNATVWKYSNGALFCVKQTSFDTKRIRFGAFVIPSMPITITTKIYLSTTEANGTLAMTYTPVELTVETEYEKHDFNCFGVCKRCGAVREGGEAAAVSVEVSSVKRSFLWFKFDFSTATIKANNARKIEVRTGWFWNPGKVIAPYDADKEYEIRITDMSGKQTTYTLIGGELNPQ